jgi:hypothetical protein
MSTATSSSSTSDTPTTAKHEWPSDGSCVYGPWMPYSQSQHYRKCVHPECSEFELRDVPKGV